LPERKPVRMRVARAQKVIGVAVPAEDMSDAFSRLALPFVREGAGGDDAFVVTPPSYRFDIEIEEDLIEEVARIYGFERIPAHPPRAAAAMGPATETRRSLHDLRERIAACDYQEVINFSFVEPDWEADFAGQTEPVRLLNPIASNLSVMRTTLVGSLVANIRYNQARTQPRIRVFEIGRVFVRDADASEGPLAVAGLRQPVRVAGAACGPAFEEQWGVATRPVDFFDVKADVEALISPLEARFESAVHPALHPGRSARILVQGVPAGWIGELHPKWQHKYELAGPVQVFELDADAIGAVPLPQPEALSKFPPVVRDVAVLVEDRVTADGILGAISAQKPPIVKEVKVFDIYRGKNLPAGKKSIAFRIVMQHTERTLTDAEADEARDSLVGLLRERFSATLRS